MTKSISVALFMLLLAGPLTAQVALVPAGTRVRIGAPSVIAGRAEGWVAQSMADSLVFVRRTSESTRLAWRDITRLEQFAGHSRLAGAKRGGLIALAACPVLCTVSVVMGAAGGVDESVGYLAGASIAGLVAFGAIIGGTMGRDQWERVYPPATATARQTPPRPASF